MVLFWNKVPKINCGFEEGLKDNTHLLVLSANEVQDIIFISSRAHFEEYSLDVKAKGTGCLLPSDPD
jgi:hypothetical protein